MEEVSTLETVYVSQDSSFDSFGVPKVFAIKGIKGTRLELLLICNALYIIREYKDDDKCLGDAITIKFSKKNFFQKWGVNASNGNRQLQVALKNLLTSYKEVLTSDNEFRTWVLVSDYSVSNDEITMSFSPGFSNILTDFSKGRFFTIDVANLSKLKKPYSIILYLFLSARKRYPTTKITLANFRVLMNIVSSYPDYKDIKKRILKPALEAINALDDVKVEVRMIGKDLTTLEFHRFAFLENDKLSKNSSITEKCRSNLEIFKKQNGYAIELIRLGATLQDVEDGNIFDNLIEYFEKFYIKKGNPEVVSKAFIKYAKRNGNVKSYLRELKLLKLK